MFPKKVTSALPIDATSRSGGFWGKTRRQGTENLRYFHSGDSHGHLNISTSHKKLIMCPRKKLLARLIDATSTAGDFLKKIENRENGQKMGKIRNIS